MQELDIRRGHYMKIEGKLSELMREVFGNVETTEDGWYVARYGAMQPIKVKIKDSKTLLIDITTVKDVDEATAIDTIKAKNRFLEMATGFNAKERAKRLQERAKKGKL